MQLPSRTRSRPTSPLVAVRGRAGLAALSLSLALVVGAAACSSSDQPSADATSTTAASDPGGGTAPVNPSGGDGTSTTAVTPAEHGPLPVVELDDDQRAYVDALMQEPPANMDAEQAECIAAHWIESVGVDAVEAAGVTAESIEAGTASISDVPVDRDTAEKIVDAYEQCEFDVTDLVVTGFSGMVAGDPAKLACIEGVVTPEVARDYMVAALMATDGGTPDLSEFQSLVEPCLT